MSKQAIVTLVERKSGMALLAKVPFKRADLVAHETEQRLKPYVSVAKTLILDNGKEYSQHQQIDKALGLQTYFADPTAAGSGAVMRTSSACSANMCKRGEH